MSEQQQVQFPRRLQEKFGDRRFCEADPPDFPNYEGAEFVLISAAEGVREELGIELDTKDESVTSTDIFNDLKNGKIRSPVEAAFTGEWE